MFSALESLKKHDEELAQFDGGDSTPLPAFMASKLFKSSEVDNNNSASFSTLQLGVPPKHPQSKTNSIKKINHFNSNEEPSHYVTVDQ